MRTTRTKEGAAPILADCAATVALLEQEIVLEERIHHLFDGVVNVNHADEGEIDLAFRPASWFSEEADHV